jgi:hypothetical protein
MMDATKTDGPLGLVSSEGLGPPATERADFERHAAGLGYSVDPDTRAGREGGYWSSHTHLMWETWQAAKRTQTVPAGWVLMPEEVTGEEAMYAQAALMDMGWCAVTCFVARYEALIRATRQRRDALTSGPNDLANRAAHPSRT